MDKVEYLLIGGRNTPAVLLSLILILRPTDTLLKIQATNVQESMTIDNTRTHCIPRKINKSYKLEINQLTKDRLKTSRLHYVFVTYARVARSRRACTW